MQARRRRRAMSLPRCRPPRYRPRSRAISPACPPARARVPGCGPQAPHAQGGSAPVPRSAGGPGTHRMQWHRPNESEWRGGTRQRNPNSARRRRRVPGRVDLGCGWGARPYLPGRMLGRRVGSQGLSASFPSLPSTELCHHHRGWLQIPGTRRGTLGHPANSGWSQKPKRGPPLALGPISWARPGFPGLPAL